MSGLKNSSAVNAKEKHWYKDADFQNKPDRNKRASVSVWGEPALEPTGGGMRCSSSLPCDLSSYASPAAARPAASTLPRVSSVMSVPEVDAAPAFSSIFTFGADGRMKW